MIGRGPRERRRSPLPRRCEQAGRPRAACGALRPVTQRRHFVAPKQKLPPTPRCAATDCQREPGEPPAPQDLPRSCPQPTTAPGCCPRAGGVTAKQHEGPRLPPPQPVGASGPAGRTRPNPPNLVGGDARDYRKALSRFQRRAPAARAGQALMPTETADEARPRRCSTAADAGVRADAAIWAALERKWRVAGDVSAAARARLYLVELDAPPPPHTSERLRRSGLWPETGGAQRARPVRRGGQRPSRPAPRRRRCCAVRRAADSSKAPTRRWPATRAWKSVQAAAAPREPRPPPSRRRRAPGAPVSETPDSSVSSPFGASPEPSPEPSPAPSDARRPPSGGDGLGSTWRTRVVSSVVSLTATASGPGRRLRLEQALANNHPVACRRG